MNNSKTTQKMEYFAKNILIIRVVIEVIHSVIVSYVEYFLAYKNSIIITNKFLKKFYLHSSSKFSLLVIYRFIYIYIHMTYEYITKIPN